MKLLTTILFIFLTTTLSAQVGKVGGWNYYVTGSNGGAALIFFPGLGEIGNDINRLISNGPHAYINAGNNPLNGWKVISLQPPTAYPSVPTITDATSFVINSTSATETSTVNWWIIN